jgi:hypothetical protein
VAEEALRASKRGDSFTASFKADWAAELQRRSSRRSSFGKSEEEAGTEGGGDAAGTAQGGRSPSGRSPKPATQGAAMLLSPSHAAWAPEPMASQNREPVLERSNSSVAELRKRFATEGPAEAGGLAQQSPKTSRAAERSPASSRSEQLNWVLKQEAEESTRDEDSTPRGD